MLPSRSRASVRCIFFPGSLSCTLSYLIDFTSLSNDPNITMENSLSRRKDGPNDGYEMGQMQPHEQRDRRESASSSPIGAMAVTVTVTEKAETLPDAVDGDKDEYPHGLPLLLIMISLCLSVLLVALDNTILVTAIPKIVNIPELLPPRLGHAG